MSPEKCNYTVFRKNIRQRFNFSLDLCGGKIPYEGKVKFLGVTFDENLNFSTLVDEIRQKCFSRLNILKILSNNKWGISKKTLSIIFKSLIGSIIDYYFPCLNLLSEQLVRKLQVLEAFLNLNLIHHLKFCIMKVWKN